MLCVIAKIDAESRGRLRDIQRIADSFGIPPRILHGHIALATFVSGDEAELIHNCKERLNNQTTFTVHYESIDVLPVPGIIVASPKKEGSLQDMHEKLTANHIDWLDVWTRTENWKPHTTLVHQPQADLDTVAKEMRRIFEPFDACVEQIEFSRVTESGYEIIGAVDLKKENIYE